MRRSRTAARLDRPEGRSRCRSTSSGSRARHPSGRAERPRLEVALESLAARRAVPVRLTVRLDGRLPGAGRGGGLLRRLREPGQHRQACAGHVRRGGGARKHGWTRSSSRSSTTASAAPTPSAAPDCAVSRTGSRRSAAGCGSGARRRRDACAGGDPVRVAIAEDSVLLREGLARLLDDAGFDVVGSVRNGGRSAPEGAQLPARRRDRRHPAAADAQRRRAAGGAGHPRAASVRRRAGALAVRRAGAGVEVARRFGRGSRVPAEGPDQRRRRVRRRRAAGRRRRLGDRPDDRLDTARAAARRTTRWHG